jgi:hypothetical protein
MGKQLKYNTIGAVIEGIMKRRCYCIDMIKTEEKLGDLCVHTRMHARAHTHTHTHTHTHHTCARRETNTPKSAGY